MNNFSPNMLKTFNTCPQKYYLKYIKKITMPQKSTPFEKGKKIHALANYYLRGDNIDKLEKALSEEESKIWNNLKSNCYFKKSYINSEYNLSCKIDKYWIGGRIDAIVKDESSYYILDYKTGAIPQNPETDFQTIVYLLCASKKFGTNIKFVYIDLKQSQDCIIELSPEKLDEYKKIIFNTCEKINQFIPPENILHSKPCDFCEYKKICI